MPDSQRSAVYKWERTVWGRRFFGTELTLAECEELIAQVWKDYGKAHPPRVTDGRGRRSAIGSVWRIALPRNLRTEAAVLHEAAHALLSPGNHSHDGVFATLMLQLWKRYTNADTSGWRKVGAIQKPRRVRFATVKETDRASGRARVLKSKA